MSEAVPNLSERAAARRQQILDAACDCVRRAGFHGASMAEIAHAAGLSVGQIYRYFENKEAIIAAIVAQDLAEMRARFAELTESGEPIAQTVIDRCAEALDKNFEPDRVALILEVMAEAARNPQVAAIVQDADAVERQLVLRVLDQARSLGCGAAELAARGEVLSMIFDGMLTRAVNNPKADRVEIARVLRAVLGLILTAPRLTS